MKPFEAKKIIFFINQKLVDRKIAGIAVSLIDTDGIAYSSYAMQQEDTSKFGGLFELIGAVECLKNTMVDHGETDINSIAQILIEAGIASHREDE